MGNTLNNPEPAIEINVGDLLHALWEKAWIILAAITLCVALACNITYFLVEPSYSATSRVYLLPRETEDISQTELIIGSQMTSDVARLAKSKSVVEPAVNNLKLDLSYEDLTKRILVENPTDTRLIDITVRDTDPQMAADISNALSSSLCDQVAIIMKTDRPTIAEKAEAPEKPSSPSMAKSIIIAAFLGLFSSIALIIITFILDDTIKTQEDVQKYLQLNTLASIPLEFSDEHSSKIRQKLSRKGK